MFPSLAKSQFHLCKYQKRSFKVLHITHGLPRTLESSGPSTTMVSYSLHPLTLPSTELSTFSRTAEASLVTRMVKNLPAMQKTQVWSLDLEDPLEKGMATHSRILAWRIPRTDKPGMLQSVGSQTVRHDWTTNTFTFPPAYLHMHDSDICSKIIQRLNKKHSSGFRYTGQRNSTQRDNG